MQPAFSAIISGWGAKLQADFWELPPVGPRNANLTFAYYCRLRAGLDEKASQGGTIKWNGLDGDKANLVSFAALCKDGRA